MSLNKTKIPYNLDIGTVIDRMIEVSGSSGLPQLAERLGLSAQAVHQARARGSISLPLLMKFVGLFGSTLDYLVWGTGDSGEKKTGCTEPEELVANDYIELKSINAVEELAGKLPAKSLKIAKEWLDMFYMGDVEDLRSYWIKDDFYLIDTSDCNVYKCFYALGTVGLPLSIRECERQLDGSIKITGEKESWSLDKLQAIGVVGRVVWFGKATTVGY